MYSTLNNLGKNYNSMTDSKKYPCCVSLPSTSSFPSYYSNQIHYPSETNPKNNLITNITPTREYFSPPSLDVNPHLASTSTTISSTFPTFESEETSSNTIFRQELFQSSSSSPSPSLLPVLDCRFNLREICKQCILLEDHLSHPEKRCTDCCIKHFLALEGLGEEAITLDSQHKYQRQLHTLPTKIRDIQKLWYQNPDQNSRLASEKLRQLRKEFMMDVFDLNSLVTCQNGSCSLSKKQKK